MMKPKTEYYGLSNCHGYSADWTGEFFLTSFANFPMA